MPRLSRWTPSPISPRTYAHDEIRVAHEQNLILPHVALDDLPARLRPARRASSLATANIGLVTDIISCPGLDYCALATARSIPIAQRISERFGASERAAEIGALTVNISGCINACGHHHVGHIGILGLEKGGVETYQITLGGSADETCSLGELTGPGFSSEKSSMRSRSSSMPISSCARTATRIFSRPIGASALAPFKESAL